QCDDLVAVWLGGDHVEGLGPDRAGGACDRDRRRHGTRLPTGPVGREPGPGCPTRAECPSVAELRSGDGLEALCSAFEVRWLRDAPQVRHRREAGTLMSADLSGFTALSERLAEQG